MTTSRLPGFYNQPLNTRLETIAQQTQLNTDEINTLSRTPSLPLARANNMIENVVGLYALPLGIATNFIVNNREMLVPMVIEEPSIVAGASFAAKLARSGGGFTATTNDPIMIGQIQLTHITNPHAAKTNILAHKPELLDLASQVDPILLKLGGGPRDIQVRILDTTPAMLIVHLLYDVRDAMGANATNTACEHLAPRLETLTDGQARLRILSNLADQRLAHARVTIPEETLAFGDFSGNAVARGIEQAWHFAAADPYRAATHNKGIMNGIDAVTIATGNDWRAIEAGAHAYAARDGRYTSLSTWRRDDTGHLVGTLELPLALGTVGGATRVHPTAPIALKILGVQTARELAEIVVSVGLAQNLAALRALATEGIQRGHMSLHARQIALAAGATDDNITRIAQTMIDQNTIRSDIATKLLPPSAGQ